MMEHNTAGKRRIGGHLHVLRSEGCRTSAGEGQGRHVVCQHTLCLGRAGKMMMQIFHSLNMVFLFNSRTQT